jgi:PhnB protein
MARKAKKKAAAKKKLKSSAVKAVPAGFGTVTSYLIVNDGNGAIEFYKKAFGAKELVKNLTPNGKVMNAQLKIGDSMVMIADEMPGTPMKSPSSIGTSTVTLHIYTKNVDKLWEQATGAGARIEMPLDNQFWGDRYGQIVDPFGHHWSLAQHIKMNKKEMEEKQRQAMAMFAPEHTEASSSSNSPPSGVA